MFICLFSLQLHQQFVVVSLLFFTLLPILPFAAKKGDVYVYILILMSKGVNADLERRYQNVLKSHKKKQEVLLQVKYLLLYQSIAARLLVLITASEFLTPSPMRGNSFGVSLMATSPVKLQPHLLTYTSQITLKKKKKRKRNLTFFFSLFARDSQHLTGSGKRTLPHLFIHLMFLF